MTAHIIVIDDDPSILELMNLILQGEAGYRVTLFPSLWSDISEVEYLQPDLIIADCKLDGQQSMWAFLEQLTSSPLLKSTPILLCTAALTEAKEHKAWVERKGIPILGKPFDVDELLQIIEHCLREKPSAFSEQQAANVPLPGEDSKTLPSL
jgi:DNA-binding response OmpR family regulator